MTPQPVLSQPIVYEVLIIGGGAAGITVAAQLQKEAPHIDIALVEPSEKHYYQPGWTLVGAGLFRQAATERQESTCIPAGVRWVRDAVTEIVPDRNVIITRSGQELGYRYLIVCPGIQIDWHKIEGLGDALGKGGVTSNYSYDCLPYTHELIRTFQGGNALFTFPSTPIKCAGAPQKIMYLADAAFRSRSGLRDRSHLIYCCAVGKIFGVAEYAASLEQVAQKRGIDVRYHHELKAIDGPRKVAIFAVTSANGDREVVIPYEILHVAPPMSAPDFIKASPLAVPNAPGGWVEVDKFTLQHKRYANVFSLGDASSLPTSRTAAAIRKQAPVVVANLLALRQRKPLSAQYNGYTCCPLVTGDDRCIMAEFDYQPKPASSFSGDPTQEKWSMWMIKRYVLPWLYWNRMLKGEKFEGDLVRLPL